MIEHRSGGHITLLFSIDKSHRLPRSQGSLGAGFTIQHGVVIQARLTTLEPTELKVFAGSKPEGKRIEEKLAPTSLNIIDSNGEPVEDSSLYLDLIEGCRSATLLRPHEGIEADIKIECPLSQGLGMSAAGLMAMGNVIHQLTGRGRLNQYYKIAHRIERKHGSGLGDVLGASVGGVELRLQPGAPGWPGQAVSFDANIPVVLVWESGGAKHTSDYIDNPEWQHSITQAGMSCMDSLRKGEWDENKWALLLDESQNFADQSGMMEETIRAQLRQTVDAVIAEQGLHNRLAARMCMLGTSVAVVPKNLAKIPKDEDLTRFMEGLSNTGLGILLSHIAPVTTLHQTRRGQEGLHQA